MSVTTEYNPIYRSGFYWDVDKDRGHTESKKRFGPPTIFSPFQLGSQQLKNRLVALPVFTGYAYPDGRVSPQLIEHYTKLAHSGVAMVVVANAAVTADGVTSTYNLRVDRDEYIPGLARLAKAIKHHGAIACLQLNHAGRFAKTEQPLLPSPTDSSNLAFNIEALKDFMNFFPLESRFKLTRNFLRQAKHWRRAMTFEDLERIIVNYGKAAVRAYCAGFDMIELHGSNGYLLCEFLSPFSNRISHGFGGSFQERAAFPLAVIREIKRQLATTFPIGFRLMIKEWVPEGIELPEAIAFGKLLDKEGIAYLSATEGTFNSIFFGDTIKKMAQPAYLRNDVAELTRMVNVPTIISGRIINPALANGLLREKVAELIGLGRPLRADFNWIQKAKNQNQKIIACMNCNWCLKRVILEQGFSCRRWPKLIQQRTELNHQLLSRNYKGLWVVTDRNDLNLFKASLPALLPHSHHYPIPISPTILFLQAENMSEISKKDRKKFLEWCRNALNSLGFSGRLMKHEVRLVNETYDKEIQMEIKRGNYGVVLIGGNRHQSWRERLLYKENRKIVALLGANGHQSKILVPVDLSMNTLLLLIFLRQFYIGKKGFELVFIHVLTGPKDPAPKRWQNFIQIADLDGNIQLTRVPVNGSVSDTILECARVENCGTIIMGKRGLSGIKRLLLGSVSAGVLRGLTGQSLFLID
jgi:2,4-dienoyl-CoA reductase-like NADH-dependent reductase (Old Yellow Enzyme family)/nucleotide-binding universal stress UspA family protein